jgi:hypothetical protein
MARQNRDHRGIGGGSRHITTQHESQSSAPRDAVPFLLRRPPRWCQSVRPLLLGALLFGLAAGPGLAQERPYYFYRGRDFGSEATFNPMVKLLQGGFYILDTDNRSNNPFNVRYGNGFSNVGWNLLHPFSAIHEYGWGRFLTTEILPNPRRRTAQWVPNYFGHILGEGMTFRATEEWFRFHGHPHPTRLALITTMLESMLNEVVENGNYRGSNVDPIADMYIFNPLGILLFRSDRVAQFFSGTLHMAYWPRQLILDPGSGTFENVGHDYIFKYSVTRFGRVGLFASYGTHSLAGLTIRRSPTHSFSVGGGVMAKELVDAQPGLPSRSLTATVVPALGVFYDRDNSLLFSLIVAPRKDDVMSLNLYPGIVRLGGASPGFFLATGGARRLSFGIHLQDVPVGLGMHFSR